MLFPEELFMVNQCTASACKYLQVVVGCCSMLILIWMNQQDYILARLIAVLRLTLH